MSYFSDDPPHPCEPVRFVSELDANQQIAANTILDRLAFESPELCAEEICLRAIDAAARNVPTTQDAVNGILELRSGPAYVYLAFHGVGRAIQFVKIGMTSHPERRLYGMATGNPLDCVCAYVARFQTRKQARAAEQALLRTNKDRRRRGEWVHAAMVGDADAQAFVSGMQAALFEAGIECRFEKFSYRDGREAQDGR